MIFLQSFLYYYHYFGSLRLTCTYMKGIFRKYHTEYSCTYAELTRLCDIERELIFYDALVGDTLL